MTNTRERELKAIKLVMAEYDKCPPAIRDAAKYAKSNWSKATLYDLRTGRQRLLPVSP